MSLVLDMFILRPTLRLTLLCTLGSCSISSSAVAVGENSTISSAKRRLVNLVSPMKMMMRLSETSAGFGPLKGGSSELSNPSTGSL